jgi:hypothetical protein
MTLPLQFRSHGDGSAEFVEAQLDWDVFTTQLECIYLLQGEQRRDTVLMRSNAAKLGPEEWYDHAT